MLYNIDVTPLLRELTVPTLVVHRTGDTVHLVKEARILADHIPGARLAEFEGEDHFPHIGDTAGWLTAVEMFIVGTSNDRPRHPRGTRSRPVTRIRTLGGFCVNRDGHDVAELSKLGFATCPSALQAPRRSCRVARAPRTTDRPVVA